VLLAPPHPLDNAPIKQLHPDHSHPVNLPPRDRSETMSTSSESYRSSSGTTDATSISTDQMSPKSMNFPSPISESPDLAILPVVDEGDVAMHPCESKRVTPEAAAKGLDTPQHPLPCAPTDNSTSDSGESSAEQESMEEPRPSCILLNALHVQDVFDLPRPGARVDPRRPASFRAAKLPAQINLRNLHIQQIKYATISDIILYAKAGVGEGVLETAEL
jgi:dual specificity MAP kinase phosphatase